MAAALIGGLVQRGLQAGRVCVADPNQEALSLLSQQYGVEITQDNCVAAQNADVLILAVKPQHVRIAALALAPALQPLKPLILSVAAGIPHAALSRWFGSDIPIVRTMPNRPSLSGFGATGLYAPASVGAAHRALAEAILRSVGEIVWIRDEPQMDTVTALSGSGPAYFFLFMESLESAARQCGLPAEVAHQLTMATAFGAVQMARHSTDSLAKLREQVTSEGGTTAAALGVLNAAGLSAIVTQALEAAERRSAELSAEFNR